MSNVSKTLELLKPEEIIEAGITALKHSRHRRIPIKIAEAVDSLLPREVPQWTKHIIWFSYLSGHGRRLACEQQIVIAMHVQESRKPKSTWPLRPGHEVGDGLNQ